jgi:hypothetical protein
VSYSEFLCVLFQNENRYNVGKGTHLVLKRAEKARAIVSKMPGEYRIITSLSMRNCVSSSYTSMDKALMVLYHA